MSSKTAYVSIHGDNLSTTWTGSIWQDSNGGQHAHAADALDVELYLYFEASGDLDDWHEGMANDLGVRYNR